MRLCSCRRSRPALTLSRSHTPPEVLRARKLLTPCCAVSANGLRVSPRPSPTFQSRAPPPPRTAHAHHCATHTTRPSQPTPCARTGVPQPGGHLRVIHPGGMTAASALQSTLTPCD